MQDTFYDIEELENVIKNRHRIFLVTGKNSFEASGAREHILPLTSDKVVHRFSDFDVNPKLEDITRGVREITAFNPDLVIAVGGGSVMDIAKLISLIPEKSIEPVIRGKQAVPQKTIPVVAIPTTAGSGSEATHFAVAYIDDTKYSVADKQLIPDFVILDARLTTSMTSYLTAVSGMDALSQAIESYWAVGATDESSDFAQQAIRKILSVFPDVVHQPTLNTRKTMLEGAHLAGKAINISKTTGAHALSYKMTTLYGIPHGHAVGLSLPYFFELNFEKNKNSVLENKLCTILGCKNALEAKNMLLKIMDQAGLKTQLTQLGASKSEDILIIAESVNTERLKNNPIEVSTGDLERIVRGIW